MKRALSLLPLLLVLYTPVIAQNFISDLQPGDLAFVGYSGSDSDEVAFVCLVDVAAGVTLYLSDMAWDDGDGEFEDHRENGTGNSESFIRFVVPTGGFLVGSVVEVRDNEDVVVYNADGTTTLHAGIVSNSFTGLSVTPSAGVDFGDLTNKDQMFVFQISGSDFHFIAGAHWNVEGGSSDSNFDASHNNINKSELPNDDGSGDNVPSGRGLTTGTSAVRFTSEVEDGNYTGPTELDSSVPLGLKADWQTQINDRGQWTQSDGATIPTQTYFTVLHKPTTGDNTLNSIQSQSLTINIADIIFDDRDDDQPDNIFSSEQGQFSKMIIQDANVTDDPDDFLYIDINLDGEFNLASGDEVVQDGDDIFRLFILFGALQYFTTETDQYQFTYKVSDGTYDSDDTGTMTINTTPSTNLLTLDQDLSEPTSGVGGQVTWTASYSSVLNTGPTSANFGLTGSLAATSSIFSVTEDPDASKGVDNAQTGDVWTVTVNLGAGNGTLGLDFDDPSGHDPVVTNTLINGVDIDNIYDVDQTAPTLDATMVFSQQNPNLTNVDLLLTFSEEMASAGTAGTDYQVFADASNPPVTSIGSGVINVLSLATDVITVEADLSGLNSGDFVRIVVSNLTDLAGNPVDGSANFAQLQFDSDFPVASNLTYISDTQLRLNLSDVGTSGLNQSLLQNAASYTVTSNGAGRTVSAVSVNSSVITLNFTAGGGTDLSNATDNTVISVDASGVLDNFGNATSPVLNLTADRVDPEVDAALVFESNTSLVVNFDQTADGAPTTLVVSEAEKAGNYSIISNGAPRVPTALSLDQTNILNPFVRLTFGGTDLSNANTGNNITVVVSNVVDQFGNSTSAAGNNVASVTADRNPPTVDPVLTIVDANNLDVLFVEPAGESGIDATSANVAANYDVLIDAGSIGSPDVSAVLQGDFLTVRLTFTGSPFEVGVALAEGQVIDVVATNVQDGFGNTIVNNLTTNVASVVVDETLPVLSAVTYVSDTEILLSFTETGSGINASTIDLTDFDVSIDGGTAFNPDAATLNATTITLDLTSNPLSFTTNPLMGAGHNSSVDVDVAASAIEDNFGNGIALTNVSLTMDRVPPRVSTALTVTTPSTLEFIIIDDDNTVDQMTAENVLNYNITGDMGTNLGSPTAASFAPGTGLVTLTVDLSPVLNGETLQVACSGVLDDFGNDITDADTYGGFSYNTLVNGPFTIGNEVNGTLSSATGIILTDDGANLLLSDISGTFDDGTPESIAETLNPTTTAIIDAASFFVYDKIATAAAGIVDNIPPSIESVTYVSPGNPATLGTIFVTFTEDVEQTTAEDNSNYFVDVDLEGDGVFDINKNICGPCATLDPNTTSNFKLVQLDLGGPALDIPTDAASGSIMRVTVFNVEDVNTNAITTTTHDITLDFDPPTLTNLTKVDNNTLTLTMELQTVNTDMTYSESISGLENTSATTAANYQLLVDGNLEGVVDGVTLDGVDDRIETITLDVTTHSAAIGSATSSLEVHVVGPADQVGNAMVASIDYSAASVVSFVPGETITGGTSGATGVVVEDLNPAANTGTITINTVAGTGIFENAETITDSSTPTPITATVNAYNPNSATFTLDATQPTVDAGLIRNSNVQLSITIRELGDGGAIGSGLIVSMDGAGDFANSALNPANYTVTSAGSPRTVESIAINSQTFNVNEEVTELLLNFTSGIGTDLSNATNGDVISVQASSSITDNQGNTIDGGNDTATKTLDTAPPEVVALLNYTSGASSAVVSFIESGSGLLQSTVENVSNYTVSVNGQDIGILGITLQTISLSTNDATLNFDAPLAAEGGSIEVIVGAGVTDIDGNSVALAANNIANILVDDTKPVALNPAFKGDALIELTINEAGSGLVFGSTTDTNSASRAANYTVTVLPASTVVAVDNVGVVDNVGTYTVSLNFDPADDLSIANNLDDIDIDIANIEDINGNVIDPVTLMIIDVDRVQPQLLSVDFVTTTRILLTFDEAMDETLAEDELNYQFTGISPGSFTATLDINADMSFDEVTLDVADFSGIADGTAVIVTVSNVTDVSGNVIDPAARQESFTFDKTPPTISEAIVNRGVPNQLVVNYVEGISRSGDPDGEPADLDDGFTVRINGSPVTLTAVPLVQSDQITYSMTPLAAPGDNITLEYDPALGDIIDDFNNELEVITNASPLLVNNDLFGDPSNLAAGCFVEGLNLTWVKPPGTKGTTWDGVFIIGKQGTGLDVDIDPTVLENLDLSTAVFNTNFASAAGDPFANDGLGNVFLSNFTADADGDINITGLNSNTDYNFAAYAYESTSISSHEVSAGIEIINQQPTYIETFQSFAGNQEITLTWSSNLTSCVENILILARQGAPIESNVDATQLEGAGRLSTNYSFDNDFTAAPDLNSFDGVGVGGQNFVVHVGSAGAGLATITGLNNNITYHFKIFLLDDDLGPEVSASLATSVEPLGAPFNPTSFVLNCATENEINLSWTQPSGTFGTNWNAVVVYGTEVYDVTSIVATVDNAEVEYTLGGAPDLSIFSPGDEFVISGAANGANNGTYAIIFVNDGTDVLTLANTNRTTLDGLNEVPAVNVDARASLDQDFTLEDGPGVGDDALSVFGNGSTVNVENGVSVVAVVESSDPADHQATISNIQNGKRYAFKAYAYRNPGSANDDLFSSGTQVVISGDPGVISSFQGAAGDTQVVLSWVNPAGTACVDNVVVIAAITSNPDGGVDPDFTQANLNLRTAVYGGVDTNFPGAADFTPVGLTITAGNKLVYNGNNTDNSVTITGLTNDSEYEFRIFLTGDQSTGDATYSTGISVTATPAGPSTALLASGSTFTAVPSTESTLPGFPVFDFIIQDDNTQPSDGIATLVTDVVIGRTSNVNTIYTNEISNLTNVLDGAVLTDGVEFMTGSVAANSITFSSIDITEPTGLGYIADDAPKTFTLQLQIKAGLSELFDTGELNFTISDANITLDGAGSQFGSSNTIQSNAYGGNANGNVEIDFTGIFNTAPTLGTVSDQGFDITSSLRESATIFYMASTEVINPLPTQADIATNNGGFQADSYVYNPITPGTFVAQTILGLDPSDEYFVYIYAEDADGNESGVIESVPASATTNPDFTPPTLSADIADPAGVFARSLVLDASLNEKGIIYWIVVPFSAFGNPLATQPGDPADIKNGTGALISGFIDANQPVTTFTEALFFLNPNTTYDIHIVAEDDTNPDVFGNVISLQRTTISESSGSVTITDGVGAAPPGIPGLCVGTFFPLDDIVIAENSGVNGGFQGSSGQPRTLILTLPDGYEFNLSSDPAPTAVGGPFASGNSNLSNVSLNVSANFITVTFSITGQNFRDKIVISGLEVIANTVTDPVQVSLQRLPTSELGGTASILGNQPGSGRAHATFTSFSIPATPLDLDLLFFCENEDLSLRIGDLTTNAATYEWYNDAGLSDLQHDAGVEGPVDDYNLDLAVNNLNDDPNDAALDEHNFFVIDRNPTSGCPSLPANVNIHVNNQPEVTIISLVGGISTSSMNFLCREDEIILQGQESTGALVGSSEIFQWEQANSNPLFEYDAGTQTNNVFPDDNNVTIVWTPEANPGNGFGADLVRNYRLVITDNVTGCASNPNAPGATFDITVRAVEDINFFADGDPLAFNNVFSVGAPLVTIEGNPNTADGGDPYTTSYSRNNPGNGAGQTPSNALANENSDEGTIDFDPTNAGAAIHSLNFEITNDATGCVVDENFEITVLEAIESITGNDVKYCEENIEDLGLVANSGDLQVFIDNDPFGMPSAGFPKIELTGHGISSTSNGLTLDLLSNIQINLSFLIGELVTFNQNPNTSIEVLNRAEDTDYFVSSSATQGNPTNSFLVNTSDMSGEEDQIITVKLNNLVEYPQGINVSIQFNQGASRTLPFYTFNPQAAYTAALAAMEVTAGEQAVITLTRSYFDGGENLQAATTEDVLVSPLPIITFNNVNGEYCVTDPMIDLNDELGDAIDVSIINGGTDDVLDIHQYEAFFFDGFIFQSIGLYNQSTVNFDQLVVDAFGSSAPGVYSASTFFRIVYTSLEDEDPLFQVFGENDPDTTPPEGCINTGSVTFTIHPEPIIPAVTESPNFVQQQRYLVYGGIANFSVGEQVFVDGMPANSPTAIVDVNDALNGFLAISVVSGVDPFMPGDVIRGADSNETATLISVNEALVFEFCEGDGSITSVNSNLFTIPSPDPNVKYNWFTGLSNPVAPLFTLEDGSLQTANATSAVVKVSELFGGIGEASNDDIYTFLLTQVEQRSPDASTPTTDPDLQFIGCESQPLFIELRIYEEPGSPVIANQGLGDNTRTVFDNSDDAPADVDQHFVFEFCEDDFDTDDNGIDITGNNALRVLDFGTVDIEIPVIPFSPKTGLFEADEVIVGQISGATAEIVTVNLYDLILDIGLTNGAFIDGEEIIGQMSGATADIELEFRWFNDLATAQNHIGEPTNVTYAPFHIGPDADATILGLDDSGFDFAANAGEGNTVNNQLYNFYLLRNDFADDHSMDDISFIDFDGCFSTITLVEIKIRPEPVAVIDGPDFFQNEFFLCAGDNVNGNGVIQTPSLNQVIYTWYDNLGNPINVGAINDREITQAELTTGGFNNNQPGTYNFEVTQRTDNDGETDDVESGFFGCESDPTPVTIIVYDTEPLPLFDAFDNTANDIPFIDSPPTDVSNPNGLVLQRLLYCEGDINQDYVFTALTEKADVSNGVRYRWRRSDNAGIDQGTAFEPIAVDDGNSITASVLQLPGTQTQGNPFVSRYFTVAQETDFLAVEAYEGANPVNTGFDGCESPQLLFEVIIFDIPDAPEVINADIDGNPRIDSEVSDFFLCEGETLDPITVQGEDLIPLPVTFKWYNDIDGVGDPAQVIFTGKTATGADLVPPAGFGLPDLSGALDAGNFTFYVTQTADIDGTSSPAFTGCESQSVEVNITIHGTSTRPRILDQEPDVSLPDEFFPELPLVCIPFGSTDAETTALIPEISVTNAQNGARIRFYDEATHDSPGFDPLDVVTYVPLADQPFGDPSFTPALSDLNIGPDLASGTTRFYVYQIQNLTNVFLGCASQERAVDVLMVIEPDLPVTLGVAGFDDNTGAQFELFTFCRGDNITDTQFDVAVPDPASTYQWWREDPTTGNFDPVLDGPPSISFSLLEQEGIVSTVAATESDMFLTETKDGCRSLPTRVRIRVGEIPETEFTYEGLCADQPFIFSTGPQSLQQGSITSIILDYGDGTIDERTRSINDPGDPTDDDPLFDESDFVFEHTFTLTGVFSVSLTMISDSDCSLEFVRRVPVIPSIPVSAGNPYIQDFESSTPQAVDLGGGNVVDLFVDGWLPDIRSLDEKRADGTTLLEQIDRLEVNTWEFGTPAGSIINSAASGSKAWVTNLDGSVADEEKSFLLSPCFDLSGMDRPMLTFNRRTQIESPQDGVVLQYSTDNGVTWSVLGDFDPGNGENTGIAWYNTDNILGNPGNQQGSADKKGEQIGWGVEANTNWIEARHKLDEIPVEERGRVIFRFAMGINTSEIEGFGMDDFVIKERERLILVEQFSGLVDGTVTLHNEEIRERLNDVSINNSDGVVITYQTDLGGADPINSLNPADPSARVLFYGVESVPSSVLDGEASISGGLSTNTQAGQRLPWSGNDFNKEVLKDPAIGLGISLSGSASGDAVAVDITIEAGSATINDQTRLYIAVVERDVESLGTVLLNVLRKLLPNGSGLALLDESGSLISSFSQTWQISRVDNPDNLFVIAFVQNNESKDILQVMIVEVGDKNDDIVTGIDDPAFGDLAVSLYPNPARDELKVSFDREMKDDFDWVVYNQVGVQLKTGIIAEGESAFYLDTSRMPSGMYFLFVGNDDRQFNHFKFIVRH